MIGRSRKRSTAAGLRTRRSQFFPEVVSALVAYRLSKIPSFSRGGGFPIFVVSGAVTRHHICKQENTNKVIFRGDWPVRGLGEMGLFSHFSCHSRPSMSFPSFFVIPAKAGIHLPLEPYRLSKILSLWREGRFHNSVHGRCPLPPVQNPTNLTMYQA